MHILILHDDGVFIAEYAYDTRDERDDACDQEHLCAFSQILIDLDKNPFSVLAEVQ
ncbi:MAG: hypothetical protein SFZ02_12410 [bacterium]|nr:hypothetical protein [bacterium]